MNLFFKSIVAFRRSSEAVGSFPAPVTIRQPPHQCMLKSHLDILSRELFGRLHKPTQSLEAG